MKQKNNARDYLFLYAAFLFYSLSSVMSKLASEHPTLSIEFLGFYFLSLAILGGYAILWQKILKRFDLITAYANRSAITIMGVVWGVALFHEPLTWNMVVGSIIMIFGIRLVAMDSVE